MDTKWTQSLTIKGVSSHTISRSASLKDLVPLMVSIRDLLRWSTKNTNFGHNPSPSSSWSSVNKISSDETDRTSETPETSDSDNFAAEYTLKANSEKYFDSFR